MKRKTLWIMMAACAMAIAPLSGCTESSSPDSSTLESSEQSSDSDSMETSAPESSEEPSEQESAEESSETEVAESNIKIVSHSLSKDFEGKDVLVIEYAYTNIDDDAKSFSFACQDSVFQNGIECSSSVIGCDEVDTQQQLNDVQSGVTYNLKVGYILQDMTNATVIIKDFLGKNTLLEETIDLGGGEGVVIDSDNLSETSVKITGHHMSKDYNGADVLIVDFEYYNGEDSAKNFMFAFSYKAFQNGVECDNNVFGCDDIDSEALMQDIQPGVTTTLSVGYHTTDTSDVSIEVTDLFGNTEYLKETISLS